MPVTLDAVANQVSHGDAVNTTAAAAETAMTVGTGSNRALIVQMCFSVDPGAISVVWDFGGSSQLMTKLLVTNNTSSRWAGLWGLINPVSGNKTLRATWLNAADFYLFSVSFNGVDQTNAASTFTHVTSATGSGANPSFNIVSASGNWTISVLTANSALPTSPTQTQDFNDGSDNLILGAGQDGTGSASVTHGWTMPSDTWVMVGTDIAAVGSINVIVDHGDYLPPIGGGWNSTVTVW